MRQRIDYFSFKFIVSINLRNSLWGSDAPLFYEFIDIISILFYNFIEFIIFSYAVLVISFAWYKEYIICLVSFSKFSDMPPAFTCARAVGNLRSICLGVDTLIRARYETIATRAKSEGCPLLFCFLLKSRSFSTILTTFSDLYFQEFLF